MLHRSWLILFRQLASFRAFFGFFVPPMRGRVSLGSIPATGGFSAL
jgi:hypothetical protein